MWTTKCWLWSIYNDFCLWWVLSKVRGPLKHYYLCARDEPCGWPRSGFCIDTQSNACHDLQVPVMQIIFHIVGRRKPPKFITPPLICMLVERDKRLADIPRAKQKGAGKVQPGPPEGVCDHPPKYCIIGMLGLRVPCTAVYTAVIIILHPRPDCCIHHSTIHTICFPATIHMQGPAIINTLIQGDFFSGNVNFLM